MTTTKTGRRTTADTLTDLAHELGCTIGMASTNLVARDGRTGDVRFSATIVDGRFYGGYTVDALGHTLWHATLRDLVRFAA